MESGQDGWTTDDYRNSSGFEGDVTTCKPVFAVELGSIHNRTSTLVTSRHRSNAHHVMSCISAPCQVLLGRGYPTPGWGLPLQLAVAAEPTASAFWLLLFFLHQVNWTISACRSEVRNLICGRLIQEVPSCANCPGPQPRKDTSLSPKCCFLSFLVCTLY